jgi:hypothetical protein
MADYGLEQFTTWSLYDAEGLQRTGIKEEEIGSLLRANGNDGNLEFYLLSENEGTQVRVQARPVPNE